jgi:hypothetical protein
MDKYNDPRRVNDKLTMVYENHFSDAYRRASVKSAKALFNSGLSHKEQLDLVVNQLHTLLERSPKGFAHDLEQLKRELDAFPAEYFEDVERTIVVNRDSGLAAPPSNVKYAGPEEFFSGAKPISRDATHHCMRVIRLALDGMSPDKRLHVMFLSQYLSYLIADVTAEPEAFVDFVAGTMIGLIEDYCEGKAERVMN